jgi:hypothetical protein
MSMMTYPQDERIQDRRSIKKRNKREDIIAAEGRCEDCNFQVLEVEEFGWQHWSVDILK